MSKASYEMTGDELLAELQTLCQAVNSAWEAHIADLNSISLNEAFLQVNAQAKEFMLMNAAWFIACMPIVAAVANSKNWHIVRDEEGVIDQLTWEGDFNLLNAAQHAFQSHRYPPLKEEDYG